MPPTTSGGEATQMSGSVELPGGTTSITVAYPASGAGQLSGTAAQVAQSIAEASPAADILGAQSVTGPAADASQGTSVEPDSGTTGPEPMDAGPD